MLRLAGYLLRATDRSCGRSRITSKTAGFICSMASRWRHFRVASKAFCSGSSFLIDHNANKSQECSLGMKRAKDTAIEKSQAWDLSLFCTFSTVWWITIPRLSAKPQTQQASYTRRSNFDLRASAAVNRIVFTILANNTQN